jgi:hypothetical protein
MSNQEQNDVPSEQGHTLDQFHDRYLHQKPPDWLMAEGTAQKRHTYDLGQHTVELDEQGTLLLYESGGPRMALSADEAYKLLVLLRDKHGDMLYKLTHQNQRSES